MPNQLSFREHDEFHREALSLLLAGALAGLAAHVAGLAWPAFGAVSGAWGLALLVAAAGFAVQKPAERLGVRALAVTAALALGTAAATILEPRGLFALPAAILLARGTTGRRFVATLVVAAGAALLARFVAVRLLGAPELAALPVWLTAAAAGAGFAFTLVLGLLPRHVDVVFDRVAEIRARVRPRLSGEVGELCDRAAEVWRRVEEGEPEPTVRRALEDAVVRLYDVAGRWAAVEADGARQPADTLVERMEQIEARIAASDDTIVRAQYEQARAALAEQLRYLKEIGTLRERVVARLHHYLAAMERLRFAVINHRSHDASQKSSEVAPILEDLRDLGRDIDLGADALGEVEREDGARPAAQA